MDWTPESISDAIIKIINAAVVIYLVILSKRHERVTSEVKQKIDNVQQSVEPFTIKE